MFEYISEPMGMHPMQASGTITQTGQAFYFYYRGGRVSLTIFKDDQVSIGASGDSVARQFELPFAWWEASLPQDVCTAFITGWVRQYLAEVDVPRNEITSSQRWSWIDGDESN